MNLHFLATGVVVLVRLWECQFLQADQSGNNAIAIVRMTGKIPKTPSAMDKDGDNSDSDSESSSDEKEGAELAGEPDQPP